MARVNAAGAEDAIYSLRDLCGKTSVAAVCWPTPAARRRGNSRNKTQKAQHRADERAAGRWPSPPGPLSRLAAREGEPRCLRARHSLSARTQRPLSRWRGRGAGGEGQIVFIATDTANIFPPRPRRPLR